MTVLSYVLIAYLALAIVLVPFAIGKPREPMSGTLGTSTIVLSALLILALSAGL